MYADPTGHNEECGLGDRYCRTGKIDMPVPAPDKNCKGEAHCKDVYDSYLAYRSVVNTLGRYPTSAEVLYMTAATEYFQYVEYGTIPAKPELSTPQAGREDLARSYYEQCRSADCRPTDLYRFLAGYEPWLGKKTRIDGNEGARAAKLLAALNSDFYGTGDQLRSDAARILDQQQARQQQWVAGWE